MLNKLLAIKIKNRIKLIQKAIENPIDCQDQILTNHIRLAKKTIFGKKHDFSNIKNYSQFSKKIPVQDYNSLKKYIDMARMGQKNILWPGKIKWFAKSSGTTKNKSKFIPVTIDSLKKCHFQAGRDMLSIYLNYYPNSQILTGKSLMIGGSTSIHKKNNHYTGDLSAIIIQNLPPWVQLKRMPSMKTALIENWEQKIKQIIQESENKNITSISGVPSWTIMILDKLIKQRHNQCLSEIWPNLELYMHGGINFEPYKNQFNKCMHTKNLNYLELYNASEGFFGIQNDFTKSDLLLLINHGIFYEFQPINTNHNKLNQKVIPLKEVEINKTYSMIITTNSGLWRYEIGDTVTFTSLKPYKIKISGRTQSFINAFGEELQENHANTAIHYACIKTNAIIQDYIAGPYFYHDKSGAHEWFIEFKKPPKKLVNFQYMLDKKLQELNCDYEAKRDGNILLKKPIIHILKKKFFYEMLKSQNKIGGQNKIQRLYNNRDFIIQLIKKL